MSGCEHVTRLFGMRHTFAPSFSAIASCARNGLIKRSYA
jgi:hypothetical protein